MVPSSSTVCPTTRVRTFHEYADTIFIPYLDHQIRDANRSDLIWDTYTSDSLRESSREKYQVIPSFLAIGWTSFGIQWTRRNCSFFWLPRLKSLAGHKTRLSTSHQGQLWYPLVPAAPWTTAIKRKQTRGFMSTFFMHWTWESRIPWYLQWIQTS